MRRDQRNKARADAERRDAERKAARTGVPVSQLKKNKFKASDRKKKSNG